MQSAASGGYTLPAGVVDAHDVWQRLRQTELPPLRALHVEDAAARVVHQALPRIVAASSTKVRSAYLGLPAPLDRYRLIQQARTEADHVGLRSLEHDHDGLFATFARPSSFFPAWQPPARIPQLPLPEDEAARLLWLASDQAATAEPWLPTYAEQDAAWWATFGEEVMARQQGQHGAQAMAAMAVGVERRDGSGTAIPAPAPAHERQAVPAGRISGSGEQ